MADMASRSIELNNQEHRMKMIQGDLREIKLMGMDSSMNVVTCNPPYMNAGLKNATDRKLISRHEVMCTLKDVCYAAAYTLKSNGKFFMVHRPNRLVDIFNELRRAHLEPKRMRLVYPYENSEANMVLLEAVKGGRVQLTVEKPLVVYKEKNIYTDEIVSIYAVS